MSAIALSDLAFVWPDGTPVFDGLDVVLGPGRIGLVGANGAGKSTLLRLIARDLSPGRGSVTVTGELGYLRQDLGLATGRRVDEVLGIHRIRKALHRIESGSGSADDFEVVGTQWDIEERAVALLGRLGLGYLTGTVHRLDRRLGTLSGGETVLLGLVAQLVTEPDVLLLDEPTNNLDRAARTRLYDVVAQFSGTVVVVGHDRDLLESMDTVAELRGGAVRLFGGNYRDYEHAVEVEQKAARAAIRDARSDMRKQARELMAARIKLDRRQRYGQKMFENKREPKIIMGQRKRQAEVSAGKLRNTHLQKVEDAERRVDHAEEMLRDDREIRVELPDTRLYPGQEVVDLREARLANGPVASLTVRGPERLAITGRNGAGKTTLLRRIAAAPPRVPWRALPQRLDIFDDDRTVYENVAAGARHADPERIRGQLARFLFRGAAADVPVAALSGGERLRAALAVLLLAEPAPGLLILDEPTNNLDLVGLRHLTQALAEYRGALIVVSHDQRFLEEIGVTRQLELTRTGLVG